MERDHLTQSCWAAGRTEYLAKKNIFFLPEDSQDDICIFSYVDDWKHLDRLPETACFTFPRGFINYAGRIHFPKINNPSVSADANCHKSPESKRTLAFTAEFPRSHSNKNKVK